MNTITTTNMIKNIIFDMGNVLLDYNPNVSLDMYTENETDRAIILNELFNGHEWVQRDLGNITIQEHFSSVKERVPEYLHETLYRCLTNWHICMVPLPGATEFLDFVKESGYSLYILSNASETFYDYFPKFKSLNFFDGVVVSADIHMIKPDIRIYKYLLDTYNIKPEESLFIDDRVNNINAAKELGINCHLFRNDFEQIKNIL